MESHHTKMFSSPGWAIFGAMHTFQSSQSPPMCIHGTLLGFKVRLPWSMSGHSLFPHYSAPHTFISVTNFLPGEREESPISQ